MPTSPPRTAVRTIALLALAVLALTASVADAARPRRRPGPNLLPNPGFEQSVFEGNPAVGAYALAQPLLPTGWAFEGSAVLFDHSPNVFRSGKRSAAISAPASGSRRMCPQGYCVDNPANAVKDAAATTYSVAPHWRTLQPVAVKAKTKYLLSSWVSWQIVTAGEGISMRVRWLNAGGMPIGVTNAAILRANGDTSNQLDWRRLNGVVVAPAGATSAHVLLGHTDDLWIGQVRFDDVYFGTAP